jgi:hypothetical protein
MARRRKNNSILADLMELIIDLTDTFWQVGAVAAAAFTWLGFSTLGWAIRKNHPVDPSQAEAAVSSAVGWLFYGLSLMIFGIAVMLAIRTFNSYQNHNRF